MQRRGATAARRVEVASFVAAASLLARPLTALLERASVGSRADWANSGSDSGKTGKGKSNIRHGKRQMKSVGIRVSDRVHATHGTARVAKREFGMQAMAALAGSATIEPGLVPQEIPISGSWAVPPPPSMACLG